MIKGTLKYLLERPFWFWLWGLIYAMILVFGLFWPTSIAVTMLKLIGIFLCLVFVFKYFKKDRFLQIAFLFTFAADVLLAINNVSAAGVLVFAFAQISHFIRLCQKPLLSKIWLIVSCLALIVAYVLPIDNQIIFFGVVYGVTLAANLGTCIYQYTKKKNLSTFYGLLGFSLFVCCDLLVAVSFFTTLGILPAFLYGIANYCCWVFYLPAQVCIANSSKSMIQ